MGKIVKFGLGNTEYRDRSQGPCKYCAAWDDTHNRHPTTTTRTTSTTRSSGIPPPKTLASHLTPHTLTPHLTHLGKPAVCLITAVTGRCRAWRSPDIA